LPPLRRGTRDVVLTNFCRYYTRVTLVISPIVPIVHEPRKASNSMLASRTTSNLFAAAVIAGSWVLAAAPAQAVLVGKTVQVEMNYDGFPYATNSGTVTPSGLDFPAGSFTGYSSLVYVTVGTGSITFGSDPSFYTAGSFNGPIYTISPATSLAVTLLSSDLPGFDQSLISVIGNTISLNFQGLQGANGTLVTIGVVVDPAPSVPEPASIALLGAGLLGLGFGRRRAGRSAA
jgi:hypothetical protein